MKTYTLPIRTFLLFSAIVEIFTFAFILMVYANQEQILQFFGLKNHLFRWEHTVYLKLLPATLLLPALFLLYALWRNKAIHKLANFNNLPHLTQNSKAWIFNLKYIFTRFGILFLLLALANPQYGLKSTPTTLQGFDVIVALDISKSMEAIDKTDYINENFSRIQRAKMALQNLLTKLNGNRIGLIIFAGDAYTLLPITSDYIAAKQFIESINTDAITQGGTDIAAALDLALHSFNFEDATAKAVIIISDGEDHEGGVEEFLTAAKEKKLIIHTIGIGSVEGSPIPDIRNGQNKGYIKDEQGNTVVSKLNEDMLKEIAQKADGVYVKAQGTQLGLEYLLGRLSEMQKSEIQTLDFINYESYYFFFVYLALFFLGLEVFISRHKK